MVVTVIFCSFLRSKLRLAGQHAGLHGLAQTLRRTRLMTSLNIPFGTFLDVSKNM